MNQPCFSCNHLLSATGLQAPFEVSNPFGVSYVMMIDDRLLHWLWQTCSAGWEIQLQFNTCYWRSSCYNVLSNTCAYFIWVGRLCSCHTIQTAEEVSALPEWCECSAGLLKDFIEAASMQCFIIATIQSYTEGQILHLDDDPPRPEVQQRHAGASSSNKGYTDLRSSELAPAPAACACKTNRENLYR